MRYCESPYFYQRRQTREIIIGDPANGGFVMGGNHPVVKQSMLTCDTMDTALSVKQTLELVAVGCQLVRITAPTVKDAANLQNIVARTAQAGLQRADCRRHPFQTRRRDGSGEMGRGRARESRQLRRLQKIRHEGIY
ncbi:MAG: flavodoxin-dependent (E)-4-hydroxy-3-methylbut-2-enyl-diphosphate synthase [Limisphaerales bacterium]